MTAGKMNVKEKIKDIHFYRAVSDISRPIADSTHTISQIGFYIVELMTAEGVRGQGYVLSFHYSPGAMEGALRDVCSFISAGEYAVYDTVLARADWDREAEYFGNTGINNCAIAAVNLAMWDAWGHTCRQPVWKMALGDSVKIMMDANQGLNVPDALELARRASSMGIQWFEEPVVHTDYAGYQLLRNQCGIALAMGEREYDFEALKQLSVRNALDLWQPDIVRLGGVEAWRESAALAEAFGLPVLPHYYKDYDIPLLCTVRSPYGAESFDWIDGIIDNAMEIENGFASPWEGDGWGFRFREECMTEV